MAVANICENLVMTTLPTYSPRDELLRRFGLRPGGSWMTQVRDYIKALEQAFKAGCAEQFWEALAPDEHDDIMDCRKHPERAKKWRVVHGDIVPRSPVYTPPDVWYEPRIKVNPLRIRGGAVAVVRPVTLALPAPRAPIALLCAAIPPVAPHNHHILRAAISETIHTKSGPVILLPGPVCRPVQRIELITDYGAATTAREG